MPSRPPSSAANAALLTEIQERKRAEQVARGQTEALAKTLDLLAAEPELDSFVGQVLKALTQQLEAEAGTFWLYDAILNAPLLRLDYKNKEIEAPKIERRESVLSQYGPVRTKRLQVFERIAEAPLDETYRQELLAHGIQTLLLVPLLSGEDLIGSFTLTDSRVRHYRPEELELAQALAHQAILAVQLTRLAEHRQKAAVLEERNRIAREIHDTLAQAFSAILLQIRVAQRIVERQPKEAWDLMADVSTLAHQGLAAARRSVWNLQPETMEYRDLAHVLKQYIARLRVSSAIPLELLIHGTPRELPPSVGMDLTRIAQESLTNALRHAQPKMVSVDITYSQHSVSLHIQDDGIGFDVQAEADKGGFGLIGMHQRAERLGSHLTITTKLAHGTEVAVVVALPSPQESE